MPTGVKPERERERGAEKARVSERERENERGINKHINIESED